MFLNTKLSANKEKTRGKETKRIIGIVWPIFLSSLISLLGGYYVGYQDKAREVMENHSKGNELLVLHKDKEGKTYTFYKEDKIQHVSKELLVYDTETKKTRIVIDDEQNPFLKEVTDIIRDQQKIIEEKIATEKACQEKLNKKPQDQIRKQKDADPFLVPF